MLGGGGEQCTCVILFLAVKFNVDNNCRACVQCVFITSLCTIIILIICVDN